MYARFPLLFACSPAPCAGSRAGDRALEASRRERGAHAGAVDALWRSVVAAPQYFRAHDALLDVALATDRLADVAARARAMPAPARASFRRGLRLMAIVTAERAKRLRPAEAYQE